MYNDELVYDDKFTSPLSAAINGAFYDREAGKVAVVLSDACYSYDLPESVWKDFKNALSKGRFYAKTIKPNHGPGEYEGDVEVDDFEKRGVPAPSMADVTGAQRVGTPKGLTYAPNATVTGGPVTTTSSTSYVALHTAEPVRAKAISYKHTIVFTVEGGNVRKSYDVDVVNVNAALDAIDELSDMLGVSFEVKEITVHFE